MEDFRKKYIESLAIDTSKMNHFLSIDRAMNFIKIKSENPNLSQGKICKRLGITEVTMRKIRNDLGIPSPYRTKTSRKKKEKKTSNEITKVSNGSTKVSNGSTKKMSKKCVKDRLASGIIPSESSDSEVNEDIDLKTENQMTRILGDKNGSW